MRSPDELGRVIKFVADDFGEHLEVLAEALPVLGGDHLEPVVRARLDVDVQTLPVLVDLARHLHGVDGVVVLVILDLEEVHALEVVHLAPGDPHPVRRHLPVLVHHRHHTRPTTGQHWVT